MVNLQKQPLEVFYEEGILRNLAAFIRKNRLWHRHFLVNFAISKNSIFAEHVWVTAFEFVTEMLIFKSSYSQMFVKNFAILVSLFLIIRFQAFFYRTPMVAASVFLRQQILFCS